MGGTGGSAGDGGSAGTTGPTPLHGERYPFPQNVTYPHGLRSSLISSSHVRAWYDAWSEKYLQACNDTVRPGVDPLSTSLVEAQGFAMIAAAYMGDKPNFDRLHAYYNAKLTSQGCGLMGWKNNCAGFEDQGAATDGDIDVASGLIVAHWQWPDGGYDAAARTVIGKLKPMILSCGGTSTLYPGCAGGRPWGGCSETDISYYSPAFFRYFAALSGDSAWTKLADDSHVIRDAGANATTGLVPDWQSTSGTPGAGSRKGYYSFDAIRTPYKHALDFLWNGNEQARAWCQKISTWAHGVGVENLKDEYQLNGSVQGANHNLAVVGSLTVCAMANTQPILDDFVAESVKLRDDFWYSGYLGNLYLLAMSGNMWNPELVGP
jgi:endo-1,4-beta-D-glucanase Y